MFFFLVVFTVLIDRFIKLEEKKRRRISRNKIHRPVMGNENKNQGNARTNEFDQREVDLIRSGRLFFCLIEFS